MRSLLAFGSALALVVSLSGAVQAQCTNCQFSIADQSIPVSATGVEILIEVRHDVDLFGYSVGLSYDPAKLNITSITNAGTLADGYEFFVPEIDAVQGVITLGVLPNVEIGFGSPVPSTPGAVLAKIVADSLGVDGETTQINFETVTVTGGEAAVLNVMSTTDGSSLAPTLDNGNICFGDCGIGPFKRADANADGGINIADPSFIANFVFGIGAQTPPPCRASADANGDDAVNIADVSFVANFVFGVSPATTPPSPGVNCGLDTGLNVLLDCETYNACP